MKYYIRIIYDFLDDIVAFNFIIGFVNKDDGQQFNEQFIKHEVSKFMHILNVNNNDNNTILREYIEELSNYQPKPLKPINIDKAINVLDKLLQIVKDHNVHSYSKYCNTGNTGNIYDEYINIRLINIELHNDEFEYNLYKINQEQDNHRDNNISDYFTNRWCETVTLEKNEYKQYLEKSFKYGEDLINILKNKSSEPIIVYMNNIEEKLMRNKGLFFEIEEKYV
jgi:hypothetical protein